jgi:hypothetical protein
MSLGFVIAGVRLDEPPFFTTTFMFCSYCWSYVCEMYEEFTILN